MKYIGFLIYALLIMSGCKKANAVAASSNVTISGASASYLTNATTATFSAAVAGTISNDNITFTYTGATSSSVDVTKMHIYLTLPNNATVMPDLDGLKDLTNPLKVTVTAGDGSTCDYTISVVKSVVLGRSLINSTAMKGICIFAAQADAFTSADWDALAASPVTDFIYIPKDAGVYQSTEAGYIANLAPKVIDFVNQLKSRRATSKIWIGTPGIGSANFSIASSSLNPIYNYLNYVKTQLGTTTWSNNIAGVYMNMESIYGTVNYSSLLGNSCIKLMNDLSFRVKNNLAKKFLWIPYYGYGVNATTIIKNIGYVANQSTIFDYVVIQPHYYFDDTIAANIDGVQSSVSNQGVRYRDGVLVTPKLSTTVIGAEMEMSWKIVPPNNYTDFLGRYNTYVEAFAPFVNVYPTIFYWDGAVQNALTSRINPFYQ